MNKAVALKKQEGLASLARPRFYPGLLLEDEDLTATVDYTRNMMRMLFKSLFGCGVICGLGVTAELTCERRKLSVTVARGVALDCMGNPIEVPRATTIEYDPDCKKPPSEVWVTVCYLEKCCRPRDISCSPDDDGQIKHTRSMDGFEIRLYDAPPECACSCARRQAPSTTNGHGPCCQDPAPTSATPASAGAASANGNGAATTGAGRATAAIPLECECYRHHYDGDCACDCGCTCVLIGAIKIDWTAATADGPIQYLTGYEFRRLIRPILRGEFACFQQALTPPQPSDDTGQDQSSGTPAAGTDATPTATATGTPGVEGASMWQTMPRTPRPFEEVFRKRWLDTPDPASVASSVSTPGTGR